MALASAALFGCLWLAFSAARVVLGVGLPSGDFTQDYLMAHALRDGAEPYVPVQQLAARYLGDPGWYPVPYVSPHPPSLLLLMTPRSLLHWQAARATWFCAELATLVALAAACWRLAGHHPRGRTVAVAALASLAWYPVRRELDLGQTMLLMALLAALAVLAYRSGNEIAAGVLIGLTLWIKFVFWPVLLLFALQRRFRALGSSALTAAAGLAAGAAVIGPERFRRYLVEVLPGADRLFRADAADISLLGAAARVLQGTTAAVDAVRAPALLPAGGAAGLIGVLLAAGLLALALALA